MTKTAGIYARISSDRELEGLGVARQQQDCEALIDRHGWDLVESFIDNDVSAYSGKGRPEYERMMAAIDAGELDVVVAWHPDRLHRSPRELEDFIDTIEASGVHVATCTSGDYDLSNPDGRLMARIVGSVARKESEDKSRRLRRKHVEIAEAGKLSGGGRRPFGYEADRLTVRADEAELIREAASRVLAGESVRSVVMEWKRRGIPTVTGADWSATTIKRMLRSGRISGQREHHGNVTADAEWPAIIAPEQTIALRSILDDRSRDNTSRAPRRNPLVGFVFCGGCTARMTTARTARGKGRYVCSSNRGGCDRVGISANGLENMVEEALFAVIDHGDLADAVADAATEGTDTDRRALLDQITADETALEQLARDHYVDRIISRREFQSARQALDRRLAESQRAVARKVSTSPLEKYGDGAGVLREAWPELNIDQRRAIIGEVIERMVIAPTTRASNFFDAARIDIEWKL